MKQCVAVLAAALVLALALAGCGSKSASSQAAPDESTSVQSLTPGGAGASSAASADAGESAPDRDLTETDREINDAVNLVLKNYADGTWPVPLAGETDYFSFFNHVPQDTSLPTKVLPGAYTWEEVGNELYGSVTYAYLPLENDYTFTIWLMPDEGVHLPHEGWFEDNRGTATAEKLELENGDNLTDVEGDRLGIFARYELHWGFGTDTGHAFWAANNKRLYVGIDGMEDVGEVSYIVKENGVFEREFAVPALDGVEWADELAQRVKADMEKAMALLREV